MEKGKGNMETLNSLQIANSMAGYDKASKELLKNKAILAVILKGVVEEYADYDYSEIQDFIESDSITDDEEVTAGRGSQRIEGEDKELIALGEKTSSFDTKFRAVNPKLSDGQFVINLHIDIESQKDYQPGYPVEKRGIYYLARELSAQLPLAAEGTDYGMLEKCYSIWICRDNVPKDERFSISFYTFENVKNYGKSRPKKSNYDLLNLVVIRLGDKVYNGVKDEEGYDVLRFLTSIMYPRQGKILDVAKEYIDFSYNTELWKEAKNMTGIGQYIYEEGVELGIEQMIRDNLEEGKGENAIISKLIRYFHLDSDTAKAYYEKYAGVAV